MTKIKRQIHASGTEEYADHRESLTDCPHCYFNQEWGAWRKTAHTLVLEPRFLRSGSVTVISECPKCFKSSWAHESFDSFATYNGCYWPKSWMNAVAKKRAEVRLQALRDWARGLCGRCAELRTGDVEFTTRRECVRGYGSVETECERFKDERSS